MEKVSSPSNAPPSVWQLRHEFRAHVREVAKDELYYLKRAGAKGRRYSRLVTAAQSAQSTRIFNRIADYAERVMPDLLAQRATWPASYQGTGLIEKTPDFMRERAQTSWRDFVAFKQQHPHLPYPPQGSAPLPNLNF